MIEKQILRYAEGLGNWQAVVLEDGVVVEACGHDDHRTRRDAAQCLDRIGA